MPASAQINLATDILVMSVSTDSGGAAATIYSQMSAAQKALYDSGEVLEMEIVPAAAIEITAPSGTEYFDLAAEAKSIPVRDPANKVSFRTDNGASSAVACQILFYKVL